MKNYIVFLILFAFTANAQTFKLLNSEAEYTLEYVLKTVVAKSKTAKAKMLCNAENCDILFAVEVKSFDSQDVNRDLHMQEVTRAALHPLIVVKAKTKTTKMDDWKQLDIEVDFAGKKHTYKNIKFEITSKDETMDVSSSFNILLSDFSIQRPKLLGIEVEDAVKISFVSKWQIEK